MPVPERQERREAQKPQWKGKAEDGKFYAILDERVFVFVEKGKPWKELRVGPDLPEDVQGQWERLTGRELPGQTPAQRSRQRVDQARREMEGDADVRSGVRERLRKPQPQWKGKAEDGKFYAILDERVFVFVEKGKPWKELRVGPDLPEDVQGQWERLTGKRIPTLHPDPSQLPPEAPEGLPTLEEAARQLNEIVSTVAGRRVRPTVDISPSFFRKRRDVLQVKIPWFLQNVRTARERLASALGTEESWDGTITFDGKYFRAENAETGEVLLSTAMYLLRQPREWKTRPLNRDDWYNRPDRHTFEYIGPDGRTYMVHKQNRDVRRSGTYDEFDFFDKETTSGYVDSIRADGSLAVRKFSQWSEHYRQWVDTGVRYYDGDNRRPKVIRVISGPATVTIPEAVGSDRMAEYELEQGHYYVPERGRPIPKYRKDPRYDANPEGERAKVAAYVREAVSGLKTPEAIGAWMSSNFDFISRGVGGIAHWTPEEGGGQEVQHPLLTVREGKGDCEDFAILAQHLLKLAGIDSIVIRQYSNHYICAYIEQRPDGKYNICWIESSGFRRFTKHYETGETFDSPREAMEMVKMIWQEKDGKSAVQWEIDRVHREGWGPTIRLAKDKKSRGQALTDQERVLLQYMDKLEDILARRGGGVLSLRPPSSMNDLTGKGRVRAFDSNWRDIVRRM